MGKGGWHVQVDSDEYFVNFNEFAEYLKSKPLSGLLFKKDINICVNVVPVIKQTDKGFLYVTNPGKNFEVFPLATNRPEYTAARRNGFFNHNTSFFIIHQTWARNEQAVWEKINSWGHEKDFVNMTSYFNLWKVLDECNFHYLRNFHPIVAENWPMLKYCKGTIILDIVNHIKNENEFKIPFYKLFLKNSRNIQRIKSLLFIK